MEETLQRNRRDEEREKQGKDARLQVVSVNPLINRTIGLTIILALNPPMVGSFRCAAVFTPFLRPMLPFAFLIGVFAADAVPSTMPRPASLVPLFHVPAAGRHRMQKAACAVARGIRSKVRVDRGSDTRGPDRNR